MSERHGTVPPPTDEQLTAMHARKSFRLVQHCEDMLARHERYIREQLEDIPEIQNWVWTD